LLMFEHKKLCNLNDYFIDFSSRIEKGVYFYRLNGYSETIEKFILEYYEIARLSGVIIDGKIQNPDEKMLEYYTEIMGVSFQMSVGFISSALTKWLPRMDDIQRKNVSFSIYDTLDLMRKNGKNENMIKNAYIKYMCWLYYRFERILKQLGNEKIPKILYCGEISKYELRLLSILSKSGCDVVLLQKNGDTGYLAVDLDNSFSSEYKTPEMTPFPDDFGILFVRNKIENQISLSRLYGTLPEYSNCTNAWIKGKGLEDITQSVLTRGDDNRFFYNCFCRINGVMDKLTYINELYQFQLQLKSSKRHLVIIENNIPPPTNDEISSINRQNYTNNEQMIMDLSRNIKYTANIQLQRVMIKAFVDVLIEEEKLPQMNIHKLTNKAVYLLCWLKRYQVQLFENWKMPEVSCFIYLGGCKNDNEAILMSFFANLPVDVLLLSPNLDKKCCLVDNSLYEINNAYSMMVEKFPSENSPIHIAENELNTVLYQDSGMFRNQQYSKAISVTLKTMYEEIAILWDKELKYRPNFSVVNSVVNTPVLCAKISGVKDRNLEQYWLSIKGLFIEDTIIVKTMPYISSTDENPIKIHATEFYKNSRVQKAKIKAHKSYAYSFLREEVQDHILDKLQMLIEQKTISGTFENGVEYTIVSTVLNLNTEILRMIQKFDFTKKNPKLIYINTTEKIISLEDSILVAFLNLIGFDIVFFVPTGYQSIEKHFNTLIMEEHQIGEYIYDMTVPDITALSSKARQSWRDKIFGRGK